MYTETIAIIDLGTNTFHLLIAEVTEREDYQIHEKFKEPVKLGEGGINKGEISSKAYKRGISALKKFKKIIDSKGAARVYAFATSAIRSASNGQEFIEKVKKEIGIEIKVINGNEEAALIFQGVRNGVNLPYFDNSLIVDIGGGSVEFVVTREHKQFLLRSLNVGAARMLETINPSDPMGSSEVKAAKAFLNENITPLFKELKEFSIPLLVGSSGSFETLGAIIAKQKGDNLAIANLNGYRFSRAEFRRVHKRLLGSTKAERLEIPGMDPIRVDMIVMASILIDLIMTELDIPEIMISAFALKEGILQNIIDEKIERIKHLMGPAEKHARAKSIRNFYRKFNIDEKHAIKVSEIATSIFDQLVSLHHYDGWEREMLKYGALLHDIGHFLNRSGHHKHGQYLVMHSGMTGFSNDELLIIGNIVRYHRKSHPTRDHFHFKVLLQEHRNMVRMMAGILRIADNLDRGHRNLVQEMAVRVEDRTIFLQIKADDDIDIEMAAANENKALFEDVFRKRLVIEQVSKLPKRKPIKVRSTPSRS